MQKPDDIPQDVWDAAVAVGDPIPNGEGDAVPWWARAIKELYDPPLSDEEVDAKWREFVSRKADLASLAVDSADPQ
jgi:hypothetical protein